MDKKDNFGLTLKEGVSSLSGGSRAQDIIFLLAISFIAVAALSVSVYNFEDNRHKTTDTFSTITMEGSGGTGTGLVRAKGKTNLTFSADSNMTITGTDSDKKIAFSSSGGSGSPGGVAGSVQFSDGSNFDGNNVFTYNSSTNALTFGGNTYPTSAGSNGEVLTADGAGGINFTSAAATAINGLSDASKNEGNFTESIMLGQAIGNLQNQTEKNTILGITSVALDGGDDNTMIGYNTASTITTGSKNTIIGSGANTITIGSNNTIIGFGAAPSSATVSNEITLGDGNITKIRAGVATLTTLSDGRDKKDVTDTQFGLDVLEKLRPVDYTWDRRVLNESDKNHSKNGTRQTGFIAQELLDAVGEDGNEILDLVYKSNPERYEVSYGNLIPVLVKSIQELSLKVKELEK